MQVQILPASFFLKTETLIERNPMTPDQITKIRQSVSKIRTYYNNLDDDLYLELDKILVLLPCPTCQTCDGSGKDPNQGSLEPCPDCQPKSCVCCEEVTEENAHLHRNCGK